jgi:hypothetical protein
VYVQQSAAISFHASHFFSLIHAHDLRCHENYSSLVLREWMMLYERCSRLRHSLQVHYDRLVALLMRIPKLFQVLVQELLQQQLAILVLSQVQVYRWEMLTDQKQEQEQKRELGLEMQMQMQAERGWEQGQNPVPMLQGAVLVRHFRS